MENEFKPQKPKTKEEKAAYDRMDNYMSKHHNLVGVVAMTALARYGEACIYVTPEGVEDITEQFLGIVKEENKDE